MRHSNLHKTRNYLIEVPEQDELEADLERLGILLPGRGLAPGVARDLVQNDCCRRAFVRGAFMAGGFIADPRGDFHLEIAVSGEEFAHDLVELFSALGVSARLNRRRGAYAIYVKSFDDIICLLKAMGARRCALAVKNVRHMKSLKNDVNRRVNAELANQARSTGAAADQVQLISQAAASVARRPPPSPRCTTASSGFSPSWTRRSRPLQTTRPLPLARQGLPPADAPLRL